ncbi:MAG: TetR/AcrR family transcriptional regulator [bacterium]|nr:TetR/AcrR family transcriptional regulator [bacterium]
MSRDPASSRELPADGSLLTARGMRSRIALLDAARRLFRSKGYANATIADITQEADRALGSFYTYFSNKEELLEQLAEDFKEEMDHQMTALDLTGDEPYDVIWRLCEVYWKGYRDHSPELAAIFQASMVDSHFARRRQEIRADARGNIAAAIRAVRLTPPDPDPEATASAIGSMMDYFCYVWLIEGGEANRSSLSDDVAVETLARVFYRTVFATPEPRKRRKRKK